VLALAALLLALATACGAWQCCSGIQNAQRQPHPEQSQGLEELVAHGRIPHLQPLGRELTLQRMGPEGTAGGSQRQQ